MFFVFSYLKITELFEVNFPTIFEFDEINWLIIEHIQITVTLHVQQIPHLFFLSSKITV